MPSSFPRLLLGLVCLLTPLLAGAPARAATIDVADGVLTITARSLERNNVVVSAGGDGRVLVTDVALYGGAGCVVGSAGVHWPKTSGSGGSAGDPGRRFSGRSQGLLPVRGF